LKQGEWQAYLRPVLFVMGQKGKGENRIFLHWQGSRPIICEDLLDYKNGNGTMIFTAYAA